MHYYQFNIADYRADTAHLSLVEHGIYRQLIDWYYLDEKPIPLETQVVMRRIQLGSDGLHYLTNVLKDFFILTDNGYYHNRIEQEIERYKTQFAKNRVNGKLGGRPTKTQVVSKNNHMETQNNPSATLTNNQEPITINHKPIKKHTSINALDDGFNEFWLAYPKKVGKTAAQKSWAKHKPIIDNVLMALRWQVNSDQWKKGFIPNPATYLNEGRWDDEPIAERMAF